MWLSIAHNRPLRETDLFQTANVSIKNYRTFRGPGFFAQLLTMIIDMLLTSLIAIEVRVLLVLQQLEEEEEDEVVVVGRNNTTNTNNEETITTSYGTSDHFNVISPPFIINPFDPHEGRRTASPEPPGIPMRPTSRGQQQQSPEQTSLYVNSVEVRRLKKTRTSNASSAEVERKEQPQAGSTTTTTKDVAYVNPTFLDEDHTV